MMRRNDSGLPHLAALDPSLPIRPSESAPNLALGPAHASGSICAAGSAPLRAHRAPASTALVSTPGPGMYAEFAVLP